MAVVRQHGDHIATRTADPATSNTKLVVVVNRHLELPEGKFGVQVGRATLRAWREAVRRESPAADEWSPDSGKIAILGADGVGELRRLSSEARRVGLPNVRITDKGVNHVNEGTLTAIAIGPGQTEHIDAITGELSAYRRE